MAPDSTYQNADVLLLVLVVLMMVVVEQKRSGRGAVGEYLGQLRRISMHFKIS